MDTNETITLKWKNLRWRVAKSDIIYAESYARHVTVHTAERNYEVVGKLSDFYRELENSGFVRIHQSFIVNIRHIKCFSYDSVTLKDSTVLPVSERKKASARAKVDELNSLF
ncbi:MAG: LytTR family transcriptional regulator [Oscillospiraceae bacterium]|nr:LytTR family transcriptional regulator [Oscillospiraceae bacterium]